MSGQILNERATIDLEPGNFEANSKKVVAALNQINAAAKNTNTSLGGAGNSAANTSSKYAALGAAMAKLRGSMNGLTGASNNLGQRMGGLSQHLQRATVASQTNTTALNGNTHAITALAGHVATLQASVNQLTAATNANTAATQNAGHAAQGAAQGFSGLGGILAGLSFGILAKEAIQLTDSYRSLETRLAITSQGIASSAGAMADVSRIARETRSGLEAIGSLYSKVAMAGSHFGATQTQVARVTETVSKGLGVMGASAQETESTIIQLGQALASGRLQGDEFRSMTENAPMLLEILAKATGKPRAALKQLATDGKLTSDVLINAFGNQSEVIKQLDEQYAKMPLTVSQSMTLFKNSIMETLGTSDQMVGATKTLAGVIQSLANNMSIILPIVTTLSYAIGVGMVANFVRARLAVGALGASLLGAFGGPIGIAITGLTIGLATLATQVAESHSLIDRLASSADDAAGKTKLTGLEALQAARGVSHFGGKAGEAAGKLWDMASAARSAAIETAKLNLTKATAERVAAEDLTSSGFHAGLARENKVLRGSGYSFGDRVRAFGRKSGLIGRYIMAPNSNDVNKAVGVARQNESEARQNLQDIQTRPEEKFIPKIDPVSSGDGKKKKGSGSKTDRVADFWKGMEREKELASLITPELEEHQKLFDLQDALMDKLGKKYKGISEADKQRVIDLLAQTRAAKLVNDIQEKTRSLSNDNVLAEKTLWMTANGETEGAIAKAKALAEFEQEAIRQKIDLNGEAYRSAMKSYGDQLDKAAKLKEIEAGIAEVRASDPYQTSRDNFDKRRDSINAAYNAEGSTITGADRSRALRRVDLDQRELENKFYTGMAEEITNVADLFGKRMGNAVDKVSKVLAAITKAASGDFTGFGPLGSLAKLATTNRDGSLNKLGEGVSDSFNNVLGGIGRTIGLGNKKTEKVATATQDTADATNEVVVQAKRLPDTLAQTLTAALIGAGIGGAIGGQAGSIGGALGGAALQQFASKALGAFAGPLGGIIGGLAGSLIGGLFKKTSKSSATITSVDQAINASGSSAALKKATSGAASDVQGGLRSLADALGGLANGAFNVSIGTYKDSWRVNQNGKALGGVKNSGAYDFGKEGQADAIKFAIQLAVKQGAITGLSDFAQKALNSLDSDSAVSLVQRFKSITDELDSMDDPIGSVVRSLNREMDSLRKSMEGVGASSTDLAKLEDYRSKKLQSILDENLSSLRDFQKSLNGSESGTPLATQLANAKTVYDSLAEQVRAGKTVDQSKFTAAAGEYNSLAAQLYGTATTQFTSINSDVSALTSQLISNITAAVKGADTSTVVNDPTTNAIADQTAALVNVLNTQVSVAQDTYDAIKEMSAYFAGGYNYSHPGFAVNGRVQLV